MSTAVLQVEREVVKCGYCLLVQFMTVSGFCRKCRKELKAEIEAEPVGRPFLVSSSMTWGAQIAQIRKDRKLSQGQVAIRMGSPRTFVSKLERRSRPATIGTVLRLASALSVNLEKILPNADKALEIHTSDLLSDPFLSELAEAGQGLNHEAFTVIVRLARKMAAGQMSFDE